jgi:hypothetical protein
MCRSLWRGRGWRAVAVGILLGLDCVLMFFFVSGRASAPPATGGVTGHAASLTARPCPDPPAPARPASAAAVAPRGALGPILDHYHPRTLPKGIVPSATLPAQLDYADGKIENCGAADPNRVIFVHYHIQHHIGTALSDLAKRNDECAPRICSQKLGHCLQSLNERGEAAHLLATNLTYVSYELTLSLEFPLPFVDPDVRKNFFFTTIMRDPLDRMLTTARHRLKDTPLHYIFPENQTVSKTLDAENKALKWLAVDTRKPFTDTAAVVALAKCRLELFDVVLTDDLLTEGLGLVCKLRGWKSCKLRKKKDKSKELRVDRAILVGWIERQRPSYELYDYARWLAADRLRKAGIEVCLFSIAARSSHCPRHALLVLAPVPALTRMQSLPTAPPNATARSVSACVIGLGSTSSVHCSPRHQHRHRVILSRDGLYHAAARDPPTHINR